MEEVSADLLPVLLPVVVVVVAVVGFVAFIFWLGSGSKRSYEEAKALASRKAEEKLKEREKKHASPKPPYKGRRPFRKKKSDDSQEDSSSSQPTKGILKPGGGVTTVSPVPSDTPVPDRPKVDFKLDTTPLKASEAGGKQSRISPPTPYPKDLIGGHPSKDEKPPVLSLDDDDAPPPREKTETKKPSAVANPPTKGSTPSPKPSGSTQPVKAPVTAGSDKSATVQKKPSRKSKQQAVVGSHDALPVSRITEILEASSLSDGEIQRLIELLLEKSNANDEWEAASLKADSNKSLKKNNAELQAKLEEAQQTLAGHTNKIKELRREIQTEKSKHTATVNGLNDRIAQQTNELAIYKTKASGLEEEMKKLKEIYEQQAVQKLSEEKGRLKAELAVYQQQVKSFTSTQSELMERNKSLQVELERSREMLKAAPGMADQLTSASSMVEAKSREVERLQNDLNHSRKEVSRLKAELGTSLSEKDTCVQNAENSIGILTRNLREVTSERDAARSDQEYLRGELNKAVATQAEAENLQKAGAKSKSDENSDLKVAVSKAEAEKGALAGNVKNLEEDLKRLGKERDDLKGEVTQLDKVREGSQRLEQDMAKATSERQNLEERLASVTKQLDEATSSRKELEEKHASRHEVASQSPLQPLSNGGDGVELGHPQQQEMATENAQLKEEVTVLKKKVEDFKLTNSELSEHLGKAKSEVAEEEKEWEKKLRQLQLESEQRAKGARTDALQECHRAHREAWQQVFSTVKVSCGDSYEEWLEEFEVKARAFLKSKESEIESLKQKVDELERQSEESTSQAKEFRSTLETTMNILKNLQAEVETRTAEHQREIEEKNRSLEKEHLASKKFQDDLSNEKTKLAEAVLQLKEEQEAAARLREEVEAAKEAGQAEDGQSERVQELEKRLQEVQEEQQRSAEKMASISEQLSQKDKACLENEQRLADECKLKEEATAKAAELKSELERIQKDLKANSDKLEIMKQSNRDLNARLSAVASPNDSEV